MQRLIRTEDKVCPVCGSNDVTTGVGGGFVKQTSSSASSGCASVGGFG